jgi:hypothetical protein
MIKVKIIKNGIQTHGAQFNTQAEAQAWIAEGTAQEWWGKPAYTEVIPAKKELQEVILSPEVLDEDGNIITPAIKEMQEIVVQEETTIEHPAEFEVQIEDITAEIEAQKAIDRALKLLSDTDWMVIRQSETGIPVPQEVSNQRAQARILISEKREQKKEKKRLT